MTDSESSDHFHCPPRKINILILNRNFNLAIGHKKSHVTKHFGYQYVSTKYPFATANGHENSNYR